MNEYNITITDNARDVIKQAAADFEEDYYLAFYVTGGGCSGLEYGLGIETGEMRIDDILIESNGIKISLDFYSRTYLVGSTIDYVETSVKQGFKIDNPNAKSSCGCNKSFSVGGDEVGSCGSCGSCGSN
jgi:iron-sulfur cluster assembly accessory protein